MSRMVGKLVLASFLAIIPFTPTHAGGARVEITGPHADGFYHVQTLDCGERGDYAVEAYAEGRVRGTRRTSVLRLEPTRERGLWTLRPLREPAGDWVLRFTARRHGQTVTTIVPLGRDGRIGETALAFGGDGRRECEHALARLAKPASR